tara:strand:- start:246 stop:887 length:642 start_codon:yes stop_codon:yes gene_type:complete
MSQIKLKHSGGNSSIIAAPSSNPASDVTFRLPNADGSAGQFMKTDGSGNLAFAAAGGAITMADQWRFTSNVSTNNSTDFLTSNWARVNSGGQGILGSGMTQSSGIFTFPDEGIYLVSFQAYAEDTDGSRSNTLDIYITTDNSSYNSRATAVFSVPDGLGTYEYGFGHTSTLVDVTDKTQVKVKFRVFSAGSVTWDSSSSQNRNAATFIRLGDT